MVNKATRPTDSLIGQDLWNIQLDKHGKLKHFLTIEGLSTDILNQILDTAESFAGVNESVKKVPLLRGKTIVKIGRCPGDLRLKRAIIEKSREWTTGQDHS